MSDDRDPGTIEADDDTAFPDDVYRRSTVASYSRQSDCANAWGNGYLPTHSQDHLGNCILYSKRHVVEGIQRPDGAGYLTHRNRTIAVRTIDGRHLFDRLGYNGPSSRTIDHPTVNLPLDAMMRSDVRPLHCIDGVYRAEAHDAAPLNYNRLVTFTDDRCLPVTSRKVGEAMLTKHIDEVFAHVGEDVLEAVRW